MPEKGETRTANGETRAWNGTRWEPTTAQADTSVPMYHPRSADTPTTAAIGELARTGKEAAIGLVRSPLDLVKNTLGMVAHPITTLENTAHAIAHPIDTVNALGDDPRAAGSLLGQLLIAPRVPGMAETAATEGPGVMGRGLGTVGRGMEAAGNAVLDSKGGIPLGMTAAGTAFSGHPLAAAAEIGLPLAAKYGGKGLQAAGRSLEGLKLAAAPALKTAAPDVNLSGVTLSPEAAARNIEGTNLRDVSGYSHDVAGKLAGIPGAGRARVTNVPMGEHAITDEMIQNAGGTVTPAPTPKAAPHFEAESDVATPDEPVDPRDQPLEASPSLRGLKVAVDDPQAALKEAAVAKYLSDSPNSALTRLYRNQAAR